MAHLKTLKISNLWKILFQDTPVGTQIMRVSATDVDEGDNQKITYDLVSLISNLFFVKYFYWSHILNGIFFKKTKQLGSLHTNQ